MIQTIICSIILIVVGILLLLFPHTIFELTQSWKYASVTDPSKLYLISTRIGGIILMGVGAVCIVVIVLIM